jgi:hypothetical protein
VPRKVDRASHKRTARLRADVAIKTTRAAAGQSRSRRSRQSEAGHLGRQAAPDPPLGLGRARAGNPGPRCGPSWPSTPSPARRRDGEGGHYPRVASLKSAFMRSTTDQLLLGLAGTLGRAWRPPDSRRRAPRPSNLSTMRICPPERSPRFGGVAFHQPSSHGPWGAVWPENVHETGVSPSGQSGFAAWPPSQAGRASSRKDTGRLAV